MRFLGTTALLLALAGLTGCGGGAGDADDVPTITTRPSVTSPSSEPPTTQPTSQAPSTQTSAPQTTATAPTSTPTAPVTTESGPSPEPPNETTVGPTTYDEALARIDQVAGEADAAISALRFSTRDDVVYCLLDDTVIGPACELSTGFIKDDEVCGADIADGVGRIETFKSRPRPVCNSDTIREPGAKVVPAPAIVTYGGINCAIERAGVTCTTAASRSGFYLGPGEYHVFRRG